MSEISSNGTQNKLELINQFMIACDLFIFILTFKITVVIHVIMLHVHMKLVACILHARERN